MGNSLRLGDHVGVKDMKKRTFQFFGIILCLIVFLVGCDPTMKKPNSENRGSSAIVEGYVMKIDKDLALVTEQPSTAYWFSNMNNLSVGQRVQVTIDGPVMDSF